MTAAAKRELINEWTSAFKDVPAIVVGNAVQEHYYTKRFAPDIDEVADLIPNGWKRYWRDKYKGVDVIEYDDDFMENTNFDTIPYDVSKRMIYKPNPNDEERNRLLKEAQAMQERRKRK